MPSPRENGTGSERTKRPPSGSRRRPRVDSIQAASGSWEKAWGSWRQLTAGGDPGTQRRSVALCLLQGRDASQGLSDDALGLHLGSEEPAGNLGHLGLLVLPAPLAGEGRRGADVNHLRRVGRLAHPSDEHRHVRALATAVGMKLVEDEKPQLAHGTLGQLELPGAGEHQLEHHVVGEQDVRRGVEDRLSLLLELLAGVPREGDRRLAVEPVAEELLQLAHLAVGQGIHRVDDDRPDALAASLAQDVVHDGD